MVLFDIDGTLVESYDFDFECYRSAIFEVLGVEIETDWGQYQHVKDTGILNEIIEDRPLQDEYESIFKEVKKQFTLRIKKYILNHEVLLISRASTFLSYLAQRYDVIIALATGGWSETAKLKLNAAGINHSAIPIASSCDHACARRHLHESLKSLSEFSETPERLRDVFVAYYKMANIEAYGGWWSKTYKQLWYIQSKV